MEKPEWPLRPTQSLVQKEYELSLISGKIKQKFQLFQFTQDGKTC